MGEDCRTSFIPHMQFGWQSRSLPSFGAPLNVGKQNGISAAANPGVDHVSVDHVSRNETMPAYASSELPNLQLGHSNGWFYCLPRFRQGFTPAPNLTAAAEKLPADHWKCFRDKFDPYGYCESGCPQNQFLVIDQSAGQTTVYRSKFGSPNECLASWHSKLHGENYLNGSYLLRRDLNHLFLPTVADEVDENRGISTESEMHEDTEEINALLYSDSDAYSSQNDDEDEVTSTGHSPSIMTTHDNQELFKGFPQEVSSAGNSKKRKLLDSYHSDIQFMDTANLQKQKKSSAKDEDDDAESRCSSGGGERSGEMGSMSASKKNIRDVLSALRSIIPDGKDKDPVMLLDDAIHCLKSMKLKVKELGFDLS